MLKVVLYSSYFQEKSRISKFEEMFNGERKLKAFNPVWLNTRYLLSSFP